jgi:hypothetical protein
MKAALYVLTLGWKPALSVSDFGAAKFGT